MNCFTKSFFMVKLKTVTVSLIESGEKGVYGRKRCIRVTFLKYTKKFIKSFLSIRYFINKRLI